MGRWHSFWLAGTGAGLFRSADGIAWERVGAYEFRVTSILRDDRRLCVGVGSGAWEVREEPDRWVQLHDETLTEVLDLGGIPGDPGLVAASAYGIATGARDDLGAIRWSWNSDALSVKERFTNTVAVDPADASRWVVGAEAGVLVASENGGRWTYSDLMGFPVRVVRRLLGNWWAGTDGRGVWRSPDGLTWRLAGRGLDEGTVFALAESDGRLLAGTLKGVAVGDGKGRWRGVGPSAVIAAIAACPERPAFWVAGAAPGGIWVTQDGGGSWRQAPGLSSTIEAVIAPEGS